MIPYHGRPFRNPDESYRGQAQSGTSHFHAYATASVIRKGQRSTVALTGVKKGESLKQRVAVHTPKADVQYTRPIDDTTEIVGRNALGLSI